MSSIRNKSATAILLGALTLVAASCDWTVQSTYHAGCIKHPHVVTVRSGKRLVKKTVVDYFCPKPTTTTAPPAGTPPLPSSGNGSTTFADAGLGGCPMFPSNNYWHADVSGLPVHAQSAAWVSSLGRTNTFHPDFGSGTWQGNTIGFPYMTVTGSQPKVPISFYYASESDPGPYPLPFNVPIEPNSDRHVIVADTGACRLYEVYDAHPGATATSAWSAGSGATWDLRSNALRPQRWTSADAAGLPILPGLVRYDEVASGRIDHAIRFTGSVVQNSFIWPARHYGSSTSTAVPPMGAWFRLRADYPMAGLSPQARVIAQAMKTHGIILADIGASWYLSGAQDSRWDNSALLQIHAISGNDMVAVDTSSLIVDPNSGQVRG